MGRHELLLSLSTDGRISDDARRAARQRDAAEAAGAPRVPATVTPGAVALKPEEIIRRMARVIVEAAPSRATVMLKDFERAGISRTEAERHYTQAFNRALLREPTIASVGEQAAA